MTGFVFLNKDENMTSFFASSRLRRLFGEKKIGHTGTLDPMATGVLPVALGSATRFIELLPDHDKAYRAQFVLGKTTDTYDITGKVLTETQFEIKKSDVESVLPNFTGKIEQIPPMYSALKKDGVRLYDLARQGIEVERQARQVEIYSLSLDEADEENGVYSISVSCSKGTYIRSLVYDIGCSLGCGAVLTKLERTAANGISIDACRSLSELEQLKESGSLSSCVTAVDKVLGFSPITVSTAQAKRFSNGGELSTERLKAKTEKSTYYNIYSPEKKFLGVGYCSDDGELLTVKRVYVER